MSDAEQDLDVEKTPLESWEDGAAFGVAAEKDPICKTPVEEWIKEVKIKSTADVPIPKNLVDQVIGQEAASIVVRKAAEQRRHVIMVGEPGTGKSMFCLLYTSPSPRD